MEKISIVTVCKNAASTIEDTILSVISQSYKNIEYIIVDGASTDGTLEIIEKYHDKITKVISEPDKGIYNAMNKGVTLSSGEYIHFLNANDKYFNEDVIKRIAESAKRHNCDFVIGDTILVSKDGHEQYRSLEDLSRITLFTDWIYHVCLFQKKRLFDDFGLFNEGYKISSDANWFIPLLQNKNITKSYVQTPVAKFNLDGISASEEYRDDTARELNQILSKNFKGFDNFIRKILNEELFFSYTSKPLRMINKYLALTYNKRKLSAYLKGFKHWQIEYKR